MSLVSQTMASQGDKGGESHPAQPPRQPRVWAAHQALGTEGTRKSFLNEGTITAVGPAKGPFSSRSLSLMRDWTRTRHQHIQCSHSAPSLFSENTNIVDEILLRALSPTWLTPLPCPTFPSLGVMNSASTTYMAPDPAGNGNVSSVFKVLNGSRQQCVSCPQP